MRCVPHTHGVRRTGLAGIALAMLAVGVAGQPAALAGVFTPLNSKRTFLHTASDPSLDAIALELASFGVVPGDRLELRRVGEFDNGPGSDVFVGMLAVFSDGPEILPSTALHRVPGAIAAGLPVNSGTTHLGGEPTDIPEDFAVCHPSYPDQTICVIVPRGATHIFVAAWDSYYGDNGDQDGDWGFELEILGECVADLDESGAVDGADMGTLLSAWGEQVMSGVPGDLDCDGDVDGADLGLLLAAWGPCGR